MIHFTPLVLFAAIYTFDNIMISIILENKTSVKPMFGVKSKYQFLMLVVKLLIWEPFVIAWACKKLIHWWDALPDQ